MSREIILPKASCKKKKLENITTKWQIFFSSLDKIGSDIKQSYIHNNYNYSGL